MNILIDDSNFKSINISDNDDNVNMKKDNDNNNFIIIILVTINLKVDYFSINAEANPSNNNFPGFYPKLQWQSVQCNRPCR